MRNDQSPNARAVEAAAAIQQNTVDQVSAVLVPKNVGDMAHVAPQRQLDYYKTTFARPDGQLNPEAIAQEYQRVGEEGYVDIVETFKRDAARQGIVVGGNRATRQGQEQGRDLGQYP